MEILIANNIFNNSTSVGKLKHESKIPRNSNRRDKYKEGVKQGDPISPTLFNLMLEGIIRRAKLHNKHIIADDLQIVAYTDDITIIAKKQKDLINTINKVEKQAKNYGLQINEEKTKYMNIGSEIEESMNHLRTQKYKFEKVTTYNYLGVSLGQTYNRIKEGIQKGYQAFGRNNLLEK